MRIDRLEIHHVRLDLVHPFGTTYGTLHERHPVIVKVTTDIGETYAEAPCLFGPMYNEETTQTTLHVLRDFLAPCVLGKEIADPTELHALMEPVRGNRIAKSALDTAMYHLLSEHENVPLAKYLGGTRGEIESGIAFGVQPTLDELVRRVGCALDDKCRRVKIKIKPGWDIEPIRRLRMEFGHFPLMVDANSAYTLDDIDRLREFDDFHLLMIEQPLGYDDLFAHALLQKQIRTPVCLDESIKSLADMQAAVALKSCRVVNLKPSRVGGLLPAIKIHDYCVEHGIELWCGGMLESAIGQSDALALASLPGFVHAADIGPSERYFKTDFISPFVEVKSGLIEVPTRAGLGFKIDPDTIAALTVERFEGRQNFEEKNT